MSNKTFLKWNLGFFVTVIALQLSGVAVFAESENGDTSESVPIITENNSNSDENIYIKHVYLDFTSSISVGETKQIEVEPADYTEPLTFTSTDESILTVDENGLITAVSPGTASIIFSYGPSSGEAYFAVLDDHPQVLIYNYLEADENVRYPGTMLTTYPYTLVAKVYPEEGDYNRLVWSSDDENIATITEDGIVTAHNPGKVRLKAMIEGCEESTGFFTMEFFEPTGPYEYPYDPDRVELQRVDTEKGEVYVKVDETVDPGWRVHPENYVGDIFFHSENSSVAMVDQNGNITGITPGYTVVFVTVYEEMVGGDYGGVRVFVTDDNLHIIIRDYKLVWVDVRNEDHIDAVITSDDDSLNVVWESSDESIATIDQNGDISFLKPGLVRFIAKIDQYPNVQDEVVKIIGDGLLDTLIYGSEADEDIVNEVVDKLRENDVDEIQAVLENNEKAQESLKKLEETYNNKNEIEVSENSSVAKIPEDGVDIIGAGLNALEEGSELNLEITPTDHEIKNVGENSEVIAFDMGLYNGDQSEEEVDLSIPVIVTLPIPETVDTESLEIRHIADNGSEEIITPILTEEEDAVVLTLTHFSTFAFVWEKDGETTPDPESDPTPIVTLINEQAPYLLIDANGEWGCYVEGQRNDSYSGYANYDGGKFFVTNGKIDTSVNGVKIDGNADPLVWYFCANGQVQTQHIGLALYDGEWFYVENGKVATDMNAFVEYDGGLFAVGAGRIISEYSGLMQDPQDPINGAWYYFAGGQAQTQYTGLAMYDNVWFYVVNGKLAVDYTGTVDYDGSTFNVENGMVK